MNERLARMLRQSPGFTLISQLASLGIVAVLLAIAVPSHMSMMPRLRLQGATRQVASDLMFARMQAVRESRGYRVVFVDKQNYQVLADADEGEPVSVLARDLSNDYQGVELEANNNPSFNRRGTASTLATIILTNQAGQRLVSVNITGRVRVQVQ